MPVRHKRPPFDPGADHTVRKPFTWDGFRYGHGEAFLMPKDKAGLRRARQFYDQRWIVLAPGKPAEKPVEKPPPKSTFSKVHRGGGWYDVLDAEGERINQARLRKDDARDLVTARLAEAA